MTKLRSTDNNAVYISRATVQGQGETPWEAVRPQIYAQGSDLQVITSETDETTLATLSVLNSGEDVYLKDGASGTVITHTLGTVFPFVRADDLLTNQNDIQTFDYSTQTLTVADWIVTTPDGSKLFMLSDNVLYEYSFGSPFKLDTLSYSGNSLDLNAGALDLSGAHAFVFFDDGNKILVADSSKEKFVALALNGQYTIGLATDLGYGYAYEVSYDASVTVTEDPTYDGGNIKGAFLTPDEKRFFYMRMNRDGNVVIAEVDLYQAGTFEGAKEVAQYDVPVPAGVAEVDINHFTFAQNGTGMFIGYADAGTEELMFLPTTDFTVPADDTNSQTLSGYFTPGFSYAKAGTFGERVYFINSTNIEQFKLDGYSFEGTVYGADLTPAGVVDLTAVSKSNLPEISVQLTDILGAMNLRDYAMDFTAETTTSATLSVPSKVFLELGDTITGTVSGGDENIALTDVQISGYDFGADTIVQSDIPVMKMDSSITRLDEPAVYYLPSGIGLIFNDDGSKLYILQNNVISEYATSSPFSFSDIVYVDEILNFSDFTYTGIEHAIEFSPDGTKMYIADDGIIREFDLSTAYDPSTAVDNGINYDTGIGTIYRIQVGPNVSGSAKLYASTSNRTYQYTLTTPFNLASITDDGVDVSGVILVKPDDGAFGYSFDSSGVTIYDTVTPYTLSGASEEDRYHISAIDGGVFDRPNARFLDNGNKLLLASRANGTNASIYDLNTPYDPLSTAVAVPLADTFAAIRNLLGGTGPITLSEDGTRFYYTSGGDSYLGALTTPFDFSSAADTTIVNSMTALDDVGSVFLEGGFSVFADTDTDFPSVRFQFYEFQNQYGESGTESPTLISVDTPMYSNSYSATIKEGNDAVLIGQPKSNNTGVLFHKWDIDTSRGLRNMFDRVLSKVYLEETYLTNIDSQAHNIEFADNGSSLYFITEKDALKLTFTAPYDINNIASFNVNAGLMVSSGFDYKGKLISQNEQFIYEYDESAADSFNFIRYELSTQGDLSSAGTGVSGTLDVVGEESVRGLCFSEDGSNIFFVNQNNFLKSYSLATAWDLDSTATANGSLDLSTYITDSFAQSVSNSMKFYENKCFIISEWGYIEVNVPASYDVSSATIVSTVEFNTTHAHMPDNSDINKKQYAFAISQDGTKFVVMTDEDNITATMYDMHRPFSFAQPPVPFGQFVDLPIPNVSNIFGQGVSIEGLSDGETFLVKYVDVSTTDEKLRVYKAPNGNLKDIYYTGNFLNISEATNRANQSNDGRSIKLIDGDTKIMLTSEDDAGYAEVIGRLDVLLDVEYPATAAVPTAYVAPSKAIAGVPTTMTWAGTFVEKDHDLISAQEGVYISYRIDADVDVPVDGVTIQLNKRSA